MMKPDWLYSEDRLALRERCLSTLLQSYGIELSHDGTPMHSTKSIYECAHDWVSQGNPDAQGITNYYETYYKG